MTPCRDHGQPEVRVRVRVRVRVGVEPWVRVGVHPQPNADADANADANPNQAYGRTSQWPHRTRLPAACNWTRLSCACFTLLVRGRGRGRVGSTVED